MTDEVKKGKFELVMPPDAAPESDSEEDGQ